MSSSDDWAGPPLRIAGEFGGVCVRVVQVGRGARLEILSEHTGRSVLLDGLTLDLLCELDPEDVPKLIRAIVEDDVADAGVATPEPNQKD